MTRNGLKRIISISDEVLVLQMVSELDTNEDVGPRGGWIVRSYID